MFCVTVLRTRLCTRNTQRNNVWFLPGTTTYVALLCTQPCETRISITLYFLLSLRFEVGRRAGFILINFSSTRSQQDPNILLSVQNKLISWQIDLVRVDLMKGKPPFLTVKTTKQLPTHSILTGGTEYTVKWVFSLTVQAEDYDTHSYPFSAKI